MLQFPCTVRQAKVTYIQNNTQKVVQEALGLIYI